MMVIICHYLCRASGDGGLEELLKLEPIEEASPFPPPGIKDTTKPTISSNDSTTQNLGSSSQNYYAPVTQDHDSATQMKDASGGSKKTFKSPAGILAGNLNRNLSIKSPPLSSAKLTALPKHIQAVQLGSKVALRCKGGNSLLSSTAMRFQSGNDGLNSILDGSPNPIPGEYV